MSRSVWPYMLSICLAYFVTLCLFPGIESEVVSCTLGTWMPVIMMAAFNLSDVIGKVREVDLSKFRNVKRVSIECCSLTSV